MELDVIISNRNNRAITIPRPVALAVVNVTALAQNTNKQNIFIM